MDENTRRFVSRAQLSRYAEVSRAAVSTWRKRHPDFPGLADPESELFDLDQVIEWLSSRVIPANARRPHEPVGTTYADRVRLRVEADVPSPDQSSPERPEIDAGAIERTVWHALDALRGSCAITQGALLIGTLAFLRAVNGKQWDVLLERVRQGTVDGALFATDFGGFLPPFIAEDFRTLETDVFTVAVMAVEAIDVQDRARETLTAVFESALAFLETNEHSRYSEPLNTPPSVVRTVVDLLATEEPLASVHDPYLRSGEFLTATVKAQSAFDSSAHLRVSGSGPNKRHLGIAEMNMLLHGIDTESVRAGWPWDEDADSGAEDLILTNPPFNLVSPLPRNEEPRTTFRYGTPPKGNANFAWLQYVVERLSPTGRAGVLMANSASRSTNAKEVAIRSGMVEDGAVECVIALPDRLFRDTSIPVTLWMLRAPTGRPEDVLFIDASELGQMASRTQRVLREEDGELIRRTHRAWRTDEIDKDEHGASDIGHIATIQEIRDAQYSLHPPSYVTGGARKENPAAQVDTLDSLLRRLRSLESEVPGIDARADRLLGEVQRWIP